jgi:hypothetical protein
MMERTESEPKSTPITKAFCVIAVIVFRTVLYLRRKTIMPVFEVDKLNDLASENYISVKVTLIVRI